MAALEWWVLDLRIGERWTVTRGNTARRDPSAPRGTPHALAVRQHGHARDDLAAFGRDFFRRGFVGYDRKHGSSINGTVAPSDFRGDGHVLCHRARNDHRRSEERRVGK